MFEVIEIATNRKVANGEILTSNVSGKRAELLNSYMDRNYAFVAVMYEGETIMRQVLAKNFGLRVRN